MGSLLDLMLFEDLQLPECEAEEAVGTGLTAWRTLEGWEVELAPSQAAFRSRVSKSYSKDWLVLVLYNPPNCVGLFYPGF